MPDGNGRTHDRDPAHTDQAAVVRTVTVIMGTVIVLTFAFGFGNVLTLALRLDVPVWVAPLVALAVNLSILGLLLGHPTSCPARHHRSRVPTSRATAHLRQPGPGVLQAITTIDRASTKSIEADVSQDSDNTDVSAVCLCRRANCGAGHDDGAAVSSEASRWGTRQSEAGATAAPKGGGSPERGYRCAGVKCASTQQLEQAVGIDDRRARHRTLWFGRRLKRAIPEWETLKKAVTCL